MNPSFQHFMNGLVDYAGLFPPAKLDMSCAVENYARYRSETQAWMLGRFICPAAWLAEFADCLPDGFASHGAWEVSALVGDGQNPGAFLDVLAAQAVAIADLEGRFGGQVRVAALEAPIPLPALLDLDSFLVKSAAGLAEVGLGGRELYLEVPAAAIPDDDPRNLEAILKLKESSPAELGPLGVKFRCGGVTADAFPSVRRLAGIIHHSCRRRLALKFTAGLHHPVRLQVKEPEVMMHGFLNVFGACLLAHAENVGPDLLEKCLAETDAAAFSFSADGFRWRDFTVGTANIEKIRGRYLAGFGSCSFDEPREDLQALGLIEQLD